VTAVGVGFAGPARPAAGRAALWLSAAAVAASAHGAVVLMALRQPPAPLPEVAAPPAITVDLAPMPVASQASEERIAPDTMDAPEVYAEVPDRMLAPPPPATVEPVVPPQETAALVPPPHLLTPPPVAEALPEVQPEGELPAPEPQEPRPMSRPKTLRVVEAPEPEVVEPALPSRAAVRAQVRTEQVEAAAAPRPAAGTRGVSPAKWQAQLMAHLERLKRYPPGAQRRREEGVAQVRFTIDDDGNVRSAQLVRSSGHDELDQAVLALVQRASPVPAPPPGAPREIVAPVRFDVR
jgi:protein TonB